MVIQEYLSCINWSNETLVARATPNSWESFTPKQLVAKEMFFTDDSSPADVSMDTAINNLLDSKDTSVIEDTTWIAMGTPSATDSDTKETTPTVVKEAVHIVTKDSPTIFSQSQVSIDISYNVIVATLLSQQINLIPSLHFYCHHMILPVCSNCFIMPYVTMITVGTSAALETSITDGNHEDSSHHGNANQLPHHIKFNDKSHKLDAITIETLNNSRVDHTGSHSVPVTPMKPYQSSSDYHQHASLLPRRSHSYEHLEEVGLSPITSSSPANQPVNQSGSGGFCFRGNVLASVGSNSDVLGE